jgi:hypothetical protein
LVVVVVAVRGYVMFTYSLSKHSQHQNPIAAAAKQYVVVVVSAVVVAFAAAAVRIEEAAAH